ncbi:MAG: phosphotransferase [Clostridia bacterium]|nr:phosphotransferase [Clostridia bacterium]
MEFIRFPETVMKELGNRTLSKDNVGRSRALVAYAGDDLVIKSDEKGSLENAAKMQKFFYENNLAPELVYYESSDRDYLISRRAEGKSAVDKAHLQNPKRLAWALGEFLARIHALSPDSCPVRSVTASLLSAFDGVLQSDFTLKTYLTEFLSISDRDEAVRIALSERQNFASDCVLHGDYCLPNVMLSDFTPVHAIDTGEGGVGDRHFDLFWGLWSLNYNLKTDACSNDFLEAYGKSLVDFARIRASACLFALERE